MLPYANFVSLMAQQRLRALNYLEEITQGHPTSDLPLRWDDCHLLRASPCEDLPSCRCFLMITFTALSGWWCILHFALLSAPRTTLCKSVLIMPLLTMLDCIWGPEPEPQLLFHRRLRHFLPSLTFLTLLCDCRSE